MDSDPIATESVYVVRGDASPEAITRSLQALLPTRSQLIRSHQLTVLDTFDRRVSRANARLTRDRALGGSSMAWQPRSAGKRLSIRVTKPVSFAWDFPEGPLQQIVAPVIGVRRLIPQAEAEESGSLLDVLDHRDKTVARLRIESGRARAPLDPLMTTSRGSWRDLPTTITLIGLRGYEDAYERLMPMMESRPGLERYPEGLDGLILSTVGASDARVASGSRISVAPTIAAEIGAQQVHLSLLDVLTANEPGLRASLDTEFLHDFRVAIRRTRSLLGQIRDVFDPELVEHFATEFAWLGRLTGPPRDLDVLLLALRERRDDFPAADMQALAGFLNQVRQHETDRLLEALDSDRYKTLLIDWETFLRRPAGLAPKGTNASRALAEVVSQRAWRLSRRIADSGKIIDEHTAADQIHAVRICAKKLRYLIDVTPAAYDPADLHRILGALKRLQRVLGDFNDAHAQEKRLVDYGLAMGAAGGPAGGVLALGRLAEQSRQRHVLLRRQVVEELSRFRAKDITSVCRRAFNPGRGKAGAR